MSKSIYFVGKPYPHTEALDLIKAKGYKIGLFLDKTISSKNIDVFDDVVTVDFSSSATILHDIIGASLEVGGLVCTYENYIVAKSHMAQYFSVPAPTIESAEMCTDKFLMRQAFMEADPEITPRFGLASNESELMEHARGWHYPLILKPTNLVKSLLVLKCNDETELKRNFAYAQEKVSELYKKYRVHGRAPQLIVEEYITGKTCSVAAFVDAHGIPHFCKGVVALTNAQDKGRNDSYIYERTLPSGFDEELEARLFDVARKGVAALKMTSSAAHIELIYNDADVKLIEIGARIGGYRPRMYNLSYGLDLIEQEIKLALGETPEVTGDFRASTAVYELFPDRIGTFAGMKGSSDTERFTYYSVKAKEGSIIGPAKDGYKAAAIIIVSSKNDEEFLQLQQSVDEIEVMVTPL